MYVICGGFILCVMGVGAGGAHEFCFFIVQED